MISGFKMKRRGWICGLSLFLAVLGLVAGLVLVPQGCRSPIVKPEAFERRVLYNEPLPAGMIEAEEGDERKVIPGTGWMADVNPEAGLTFAGYRRSEGTVRFCLVLACDPNRDRLVLLPLDGGETPLTVLGDRRRCTALKETLAAFRNGPAGNGVHRELIRLSLSRAIAEKKLGSPIPMPGRIFAVSSNFLSHLHYDLVMTDGGTIKRLENTRARVFQKYPPLPPPNKGRTKEAIPVPSGVMGPYDGIGYPFYITLPPEGADSPGAERETRLDYEVEIGAVLGRVLTWNDLEDMDDREIHRAVAGYLLISDVKARNPQVMGKILAQDRPYPEVPSPYLCGNEGLDRTFGLWSRETCRWWSYAASWGDYAAMGPFFEAAPGEGSFPARNMISARSYGPADRRGAPVPDGRAEGVLYLRQCSIATEEGCGSERMLWDIPDILRSILAPDSVLEFDGDPPRLEAGDVICLGTPGGAVITSRSQAVIRFLKTMLFWWDPLDWHDGFFEDERELYLLEGDEVFFWVEGLGYQHHPIRPMKGE